jgi:hypothetical protein
VFVGAHGVPSLWPPMSFWDTMEGTFNQDLKGKRVGEVKARETELLKLCGYEGQGIGRERSRIDKASKILGAGLLSWSGPE